jgi:hypothetical protein
MIMSAQQSSPDATSLILMGSAPFTASTIENDGLNDCHQAKSSAAFSALEISQVGNAPTAASSSIQSEAFTAAPLSHDISASDDHSDNDNKRSIEEVSMSSEGEILEERRAKNRLSAHQSRLRKRNQLKYLQKQVNALSEKKQGTQVHQ